jgi:hypothetical protein
METGTFDEVVDAVMRLPREQQEMLLEIVRRRQIELRREEIAGDAERSRRAFLSGELKPQPNVSQLFAELQGRVVYHEDIDEPTIDEWADLEP